MLVNSQDCFNEELTVHIWCTGRTHSQRTFIKKKVAGFALAEDKPVREKVFLLPLFLHLDGLVYPRMVVLHLMFNYISSTAVSGIFSFHNTSIPQLDSRLR